MKATFKEMNHATKFNPNHRRPDSQFNEEYAAIVFNGRGAYTAVTLRIYSTAARSYCCLWVNDNCSWYPDEKRDAYWRHSTGWAGGYGYHRASAAAQEAIYNAGIELDQDINGRGDSAIEEAVYSIAVAMWGGAKYKIYVQHARA